MAPGSQADLFAPERPLSSDGLRAWAPAQWLTAADWQPLLQDFFASPAGLGLAHYVEARLSAGAVIYPSQPLRALALTALSQVRVVILGQDPYHGPGQAEGLAFSVAPGVALPPSLRNIHKELARDPLLPAREQPRGGSLAAWAGQGVLLLNACLTVEQGCPAAHAGKGWEALTDRLLLAVLRCNRPVVFMLWGAHAQKRYAALAHAAGGTGGARLVLSANHPSPLSALRPPEPFIGCGHFGQANQFLRHHGGAPIDW